MGPHDDFFDALRRELAADPDQLPSEQEVYDDVLYDLTETVRSVWDEADYLPGGRGDYRKVRYVDVTGIEYLVIVWRNRRTGVLEMHDVKVTAAPPYDEHPADT